MADSFPAQEGYFPLLLTANALEEEVENSNNRSMSLSDLDNTEDSAQTINHDVNLHDATTLRSYCPTTVNAEKQNLETMEASSLSCSLNTTQFPSSSLLGIFSSDINDWNLTSQDLFLGMDANGLDEINLTSLAWEEKIDSLEACCLLKDSDSESSLSSDLTHSSSFDFTCDSDTESLIYDLGMVGGYSLKHNQYCCTDYQSHYGQGEELLVSVFHDHTYSQSTHQKASSMSENDIWLEKLSKGTMRKLSNINRNPSHDEYCVKALRIPFAINDIVTLPVDSFNSMLSKYCLTDNQLSLIRDIRRRGKNKVAAQNCRKRKLDVIMNLKDDVCHLQTEKEKLKRQKTKRNRSISNIKQKINFLCWDIFNRLRGDKGISIN
nr:PREDICTED: nuclear factor erythroid 2-related factor 3 [Anolis carolinensis]XP_008110884.1 PREDICTED: nuclear factor erythroid 2-related factor 3 [Anolis carolinensis]|eukprot:XP_003222201.1 PREDICTED: nuclear factor erythroid 2-related factor 3 [Anolis carolinensis]